MISTSFRFREHILLFVDNLKPHFKTDYKHCGQIKRVDNKSKLIPFHITKQFIHFNHKPKVKDVYTDVEVEGLDDTGNGVITVWWKSPNLMESIVKIPGGIPGEKVTLEVMSVRKIQNHTRISLTVFGRREVIAKPGSMGSAYTYQSSVHLLNKYTKYSPHMKDNYCLHFDHRHIEKSCGGCSFAALKYERQVIEKERMVRETLVRVLKGYRKNSNLEKKECYNKISTEYALDKFSRLIRFPGSTSKGLHRAEMSVGYQDDMTPPIIGHHAMKYPAPGEIQIVVDTAGTCPLLTNILSRVQYKIKEYIKENYYKDRELWNGYDSRNNYGTFRKFILFEGINSNGEIKVLVEMILAREVDKSLLSSFVQQLTSTVAEIKVIIASFELGRSTTPGTYNSESSRYTRINGSRENRTKSRKVESLLLFGDKFSIGHQLSFFQMNDNKNNNNNKEEEEPSSLNVNYSLRISPGNVLPIFSALHRPLLCTMIWMLRCDIGKKEEKFRRLNVIPTRISEVDKSNIWEFFPGNGPLTVLLKDYYNVFLLEPNQKKKLLLEETIDLPVYLSNDLLVPFSDSHINNDRIFNNQKLEIKKINKNKNKSRIKNETSLNRDTCHATGNDMVPDIKKNMGISLLPTDPRQSNMITKSGLTDLATRLHKSFAIRIIEFCDSGGMDDLGNVRYILDRILSTRRNSKDILGSNELHETMNFLESPPEVKSILSKKLKGIMERASNRSQKMGKLDRIRCRVLLSYLHLTSLKNIDRGLSDGDISEMQINDLLGVNHQEDIIIENNIHSFEIETRDDYQVDAILNEWKKCSIAIPDVAVFSFPPRNRKDDITGTMGRDVRRFLRVFSVPVVVCNSESVQATVRDAMHMHHLGYDCSDMKIFDACPDTMKMYVVSRYTLRTQGNQEIVTNYNNNNNDILKSQLIERSNNDNINIDLVEQARRTIARIKAKEFKRPKENTIRKSIFRDIQQKRLTMNRFSGTVKIMRKRKRDM